MKTQLFADRIRWFQSVGSSLPERLKNALEWLSGLSMDGVKVHYNSAEPARFGALAFARGREIYLAPGQERHLAHEAWHVVQQLQGRVAATIEGNGWVLNDDPVLEWEAAWMGNKALRLGEVGRFPTQTVFPTAVYPGVIQRIRSNYKLVLTDEESHRLASIVADDAYPQSSVDKFVEGLARSQMVFYDGTMAALMESSSWNTAVVTDPFGAKAPLTLWQCPNCKQPTTYQGIDRGHDANWKPELKKAGVKNLAEATLVYNNLLNLRIECRSCNVSHAFERDTKGHFTDLPTKADFVESRSPGVTIKEAEKKHGEFMEGYSGMDMDAYDMTDPFIDNTGYTEAVLITRDKIWLTDEGGLASGTGGWFGKTMVRVLDEGKGRYIKVEIVDTADEELKNYIGRTLWGNSRNLKKGEVSIF